MITLTELTKYLDEYLDVDSIKDYCPKGLQVEGAPEITKIVTGVSACMELFEQAAQAAQAAGQGGTSSTGAQAVLVHHGMFWDSDPRVVRGSLRKRLKFLLDNNLSLLAYHLPLDCHPEVGNNIQIVKALGLIDPVPFGEAHSKPLGFIAGPQAPAKLDTFMEIVRDRINKDLTHYDFGPDEISKVAICSGGCQSLLRSAIGQGADMFITGEDSEWIYHLCKEAGYSLHSRWASCDGTVRCSRVGRQDSRKV